MQRREPYLGAGAALFEMKDRYRRQSLAAGGHVPACHVARLPRARRDGLALPGDPEIRAERERFRVGFAGLADEVVDLVIGHTQRALQQQRSNAHHREAHWN